MSNVGSIRLICILPNKYLSNTYSFKKFVESVGCVSHIHIKLHAS
jgi:hypothetical protein